MTGDTMTIDEARWAAAKAKRQRDEWQRQAVQYRNERDALKAKMTTEASAAQADYRRAIDALGTAYRLIVQHHNCSKPIVPGQCCPHCVREDGTEPELDQISSVLREARAKLIDNAETRRQEPPKGDT
jgi:ribosomal protein L32